MLSFESFIMKTGEILLGSLRLGAGNPLFLIAGPCVIESEAHSRMMAEKIARIAADSGMPYIFKASYDKANRSSVSAFRGPGLTEGLKILCKIKSELKVPVLTDSTGRRSRGHCADSRISGAANRFAGRCWQNGPHR